jgi:hypothetical protein
MFGTRLRVHSGTVGDKEPAGLGKGSKFRRVIARVSRTRQMNPTQAIRLHDADYIGLTEGNVRGSKSRVRLGADKDRFGSAPREDKFMRHGALGEKLLCRIAQRSITEDTQPRHCHGSDVFVQGFTFEGLARRSLIMGYKS